MSIPAKQRTSVTAILGGVQMIGMAIAPLFSALITGVDFDIFGIHFDYLNTVGLILVVINLASQVIIHLFLPDLESVDSSSGSDKDEEEEKESEWLMMFRCILGNPHIGIPFLTIFTFNFNWQFIETALAPASFDVFEWGPVEVSFILGIMAVILFGGMTLVATLSKRGVSDFKLLVFGLMTNTVGYAMLYALWYRGVYWALFISPVFVGAGSFPFLGAPNRSLFSEAVDLTPELVGFEGTMQALLSMSSSVGGFTAPSMITHFCLREPDEVSASKDGREFTPVALFSPLLSLAVLLATFLGGDPAKEDEAIELKDEIENGIPGETTPLAEKFRHRRVQSVGVGETNFKPEQIYHKRRSDGDGLRSPKDKGRPCRRRSLVSSARAASIRGSMIDAMAFTPHDVFGKDEDDIDEEEFGSDDFDDDSFLNEIEYSKS